MTALIAGNRRPRRSKAMARCRRSQQPNKEALPRLQDSISPVAGIKLYTSTASSPRLADPSSSRTWTVRVSPGNRGTIVEVRQIGWHLRAVRWAPQPCKTVSRETCPRGRPISAAAAEKLRGAKERTVLKSSAESVHVVWSMRDKRYWHNQIGNESRSDPPAGSRFPH
ncbi:hypothetical protein VTK56DRAFT_10188 [Thermocarpiscus australiensis]